MLILTPCATCARHVRSDDAACPFCGADAARGEASAGRASAQRLSRAALFAGAAGLIVAAADCITAEPLYGGVPIPPETTSGSSTGDAGSADTGADGGPTVDGTDRAG